MIKKSFAWFELTLIMKKKSWYNNFRIYLLVVFHAINWQNKEFFVTKKRHHTNKRINRLYNTEIKDWKRVLNMALVNVGPSEIALL